MASATRPTDGELRTKAEIAVAAMPAAIVRSLGKDPVATLYKRMQNSFAAEVASVVAVLEPITNKKKADNLQDLLDELGKVGKPKVTLADLRKQFPSYIPFAKADAAALSDDEFKELATVGVLLNRIHEISVNYRLQIYSTLEQLYAVYIKIESSPQREKIYKQIRVYLKQFGLTVHHDYDNAGVLCKAAFQEAKSPTLNKYYTTLQDALRQGIKVEDFSREIQAKGGVNFASKQMAKLKPKVTIDVAKRLAISDATIARGVFEEIAIPPMMTVTFTDAAWRKAFFTDDNFVLLLGTFAGSKNTVDILTSLPLNEAEEDVIFNKLALLIKENEKFKNRKAELKKQLDKRIADVKAAAASQNYGDAGYDEKLAKQLGKQLHPKKPKSNKPKAAKKTAA